MGVAGVAGGAACGAACGAGAASGVGVAAGAGAAADDVVFMADWVPVVPAQAASATAAAAANNDVFNMCNAFLLRPIPEGRIRKAVVPVSAAFRGRARRLGG